MVTTLLIQSLGIVGWLFLLFSYWNKDIDRLLVFQLISGLFYIFHYYFLGATEGMIVIGFELVRDYSYYKTDKDKFIFLLTIPIYIILGILNFNGIISLFPSISSLIDGYSLSYNQRLAVIGSIVTECLWLVYDISSKSYSGILTGSIMIFSNLVVLFTINKKKVN